MSLDLDALPADVLDFLTERHLATLTTLRRDGTPHVVPVGFTYDARDQDRPGDHQRRVGQGPQRRPSRRGGRDLPGRRRTVVDRQRAGAGGHATPKWSRMPSPAMPGATGNRG